MRQNFNHAFMATTGDYLIYFGDDDGILPRQFKFLREVLERHEPDGLSWARATYGWPIEGYGKKTGGIRSFKNRTFGSVREYQGSENRENLLACRLNLMTPMPEIYHGCISRNYLVRTATSSDLIFDSAIPDYNIAYRAVLKNGRFFHIDHVFSINGYSPASTGGGQNAAQTKTGDDGTSKLFEAENKIDPVTDVIAYASSVPLAFFSTLETVRKKHGLMKYKPDYTAWYRYVLGSSRYNSDLNAVLLKLMSKHAEATDSFDELAKARKLPLQPKRTWSELFAKWNSILFSFRVSAEKDGNNTILTAVQVLDAILDDDFGQVRSANMNKAAAWTAAKHRSKRFKKQL
tara:strand:- start:163 stop:1203 length:1041 start_codon:yes stop_codon:yes gene_type:complete